MRNKEIVDILCRYFEKQKSMDTTGDYGDY